MLNRGRLFMAEPKRPLSVDYAQHKHLKENPLCSISGIQDHCQAHHIVDYYACVMIGRPKLAEYSKNFITLTEGMLDLHLLFGHFGDFKSINLDIITNLFIYKQMGIDLKTHEAIKLNQKWKGCSLYRIKPVQEWDSTYAQWFESEVELIFPKGIEG